MRSFAAASIVAASLTTLVAGVEHVTQLDLSKHLDTDKVDIAATGPGEYEWSLPTGAGQTLTIDLASLGIDPGKYDEIRFDLKPMGSQVGLHVELLGHPGKDERSSWYLKFPAPAEQWSSGRFDLHLDDDGLYLGKLRENEKPGTMKIHLYRRPLGFPGEPSWRKAAIRNLRFVKRLISVDFELRETELIENAGEVGAQYALRVRNNTDKELKAIIELDSAKTLKYFEASCPDQELVLQAKEERGIPIRVFMPATRAMRLPRLYSEPLVPRVTVPGVEDSDVIPLMGYRRFPMWGTVPIFHKLRWTPETFQALLDAREKVLPGVKNWRAGVVGAADEAMKYKWPVPDFGPPGHDQGYRCDKCKNWLQPVTPTDLHKHTCPKCGALFVNNDFYDRAWLMRYNGRRANDVRNLALAWLSTGKVEYAAKATEILLDYAAGYPKMPIVGLRSTSGGSRLGGSTLHSSYVVPGFAEGWSYLEAAPCLDEEKRGKIVALLQQMGFELVRHSVEYNNQQAEHFRAYGTVGIATGFWPLAAEAIYGDFGWHELVEYGYSEDGIAHEAGAYHRAVFHAMTRFGIFAYRYGLDLFTPRFKRVFDGTLAAGLGGGDAYELAYIAYRDPRYLPTIEEARTNPGETTILYGIAGLPKIEKLPAESILMPGAGYVHLRKGTAADWMGISLNYIKQFDRGELDKLTTFFYKNGTQVDSTVGRITYGSRHANWMCFTAAHNAIVIDGGNERDLDCQLVAYDPSRDAPIAVVSTKPAAPLYEGVSQLRCIALIEDVYVVFDRVACDKPRTIDRYQYGKGTATLEFKTEPLQAPPPSVPEAGIFSRMEGGKCGAELRIDFQNDLRMRLVSDGDMEAYKGLTVGSYQATPMEFTFARRSNAKDATFLAAFVLGKEKEPPLVKIVRSSQDEIRFEISTAAKTYTVTIRPAEKSAIIQ